MCGTSVPECDLDGAEGWEGGGDGSRGSGGGGGGGTGVAVVDTMYVDGADAM